MKILRCGQCGAPNKVPPDDEFEKVLRLHAIEAENRKKIDKALEIFKECTDEDANFRDLCEDMAEALSDDDS